MRMTGVQHTFADWPAECWDSFVDLVPMVHAPVQIVVVVHVWDDFEVVAGDLHGCIIVACDSELESDGAKGAASETCAVLESWSEPSLLQRQMVHALLCTEWLHRTLC